MKNRIAKLKNIKSKIITQKDDVKIEFLKNNSQFPLLVKALNSDILLGSWLENNKTVFEGDLLKYGSILFRGFKIDTTKKFQDLMSVFPNNPLDYTLRSSPRYSLAENVYVSTVYPKDQSIMMHSENSYAPTHPERIVFCCTQEPTVGGETPIADNRMILSFLSDSIRRKFEEKGIKYKRNLNTVIGLKWQEVFQSSDKEYVEETCQKNGMKFEWKNENDLILEWTKKAIWSHPISEDLVWFNHGVFFNKYSLDKSIINAVNSNNELPNDTFFGDGTEISREDIEELQSAYKKSTIEFSWEKGDVLFLDNLLMSHGRNPFEGDREIIVSIF